MRGSLVFVDRSLRVTSFITHRSEVGEYVELVLGDVLRLVIAYRDGKQRTAEAYDAVMEWFASTHGASTPTVFAGDWNW